MTEQIVMYFPVVMSVIVFISVLILALFMAREIRTKDKLIHDLMDRFMAKDFGELVTVQKEENNPEHPERKFEEWVTDQDELAMYMQSLGDELPRSPDFPPDMGRN